MTFLAGHGEICPPHGRSAWRPADQPTTRRSTWISCMVFLKKHQVPVDQCLVGWSAGGHVDHPCGGQLSPWPAREVTKFAVVNHYWKCSDSLYFQEWITTRSKVTTDSEFTTHTVFSMSGSLGLLSCSKLSPNLNRAAPWRERSTAWASQQLAWKTSSFEDFLKVGGHGRRGIPPHHERYNVCPWSCRDARTVTWQYRGRVQGAERHRTIIPGDTQMSFPQVKVPPP